MGDYYVPGGVDLFRMIRLIVGYVSRRSYSVCHDKHIYPEPLVFRPERYPNDTPVLI
jgi:hypothetical protein